MKVKINDFDQEHDDINQNDITDIDMNTDDNTDEDNNIHSEPILNPSLSSVKPKSNKLSALVVVLLIVLLVAATGAVWYVMFYEKSQSNSNTSADTLSQQVLEQAAEVDTQLAKFITPTTGETWLDAPVEIEKQGYYSSDGKNGAEDDMAYYQVGLRGENTIIMTKYQDFRTIYGLFEKSTDGKITLINHPDAYAVYNTDYEANLLASLDPNVEVSDDIHYDSLSIPSQIIINDKGSVVMAPLSPNLGEEYTEPVSNSYATTKRSIIKQLGKSTLYLNESTNSETELVSVGYFIKTPLNSKIDLRYEPLDLPLLNYKWETGYASSDDSLHAISRGCSLATTAVTRSDAITENDVRAVGRSAKDLVVYELIGLENPLFIKAYNEFKLYYPSIGTNPNKDITPEQFAEQHAVVIYKDVNGKWLVYVRGDLAPEGGCAKPVVYLYPEQTEQVNVKVGADVKISDPYYDPKTGWSALAEPNGQLAVNGSLYDSLFWEGPGFGQYPEITEGLVIKQQDVISTIHQQLVQQGLSSNEIDDFVDYWQGKLPANPYIRLTWFDTTQINQLAPLYISPKPDTLIRVFLDASGLDTPISIPSQDLKSIPRSGFTVVEWGGLPNFQLY